VCAPVLAFVLIAQQSMGGKAGAISIVIIDKQTAWYAALANTSAESQNIERMIITIT
jgi:hypothetical protein